MVHYILLFYIVVMTTISCLKNVEWVHRKVLLVRDWFRSRRLVEVQYIGPVV